MKPPVRGGLYAPIIMGRALNFSDASFAFDI